MTENTDPIFTQALSQNLSTVTESPTHLNLSARRGPLRSLRLRLRRFRGLAWITLGVTCLLLFTLIKLPSAKIRNFVEGNIAAVLSPYGVGFTVGNGSISIITGLSYVMKDVVLSFPPPVEPVTFDKVRIRPTFLSMLVGRVGAAVTLVQKDSDIVLKASLDPLSSQLKSFELELDNVDLERLGFIQHMSNMAVTGIATGELTVSGDLSDLQKSSGKVRFDLKRLSLDPQPIKGFKLPKISVAEGMIDGSITAGKLSLSTLQLGKKGSPSDDVFLRASGESGLSKSLMNSSLNLKTEFSFSQNILKSVAIIETFLASAKQADGTYCYQLQGILSSPSPVPCTPK